MSVTPHSLSEFSFGSMLVRYSRDCESGKVGLTILPVVHADSCVPRRAFLEGVDVASYTAAQSRKLRAWTIESLAQVHERRDGSASAFAQGRTMRGSPTTAQLQFEEQTTAEAGSRLTIRTSFVHPAHSWRLHHSLTWHRGSTWLESHTTVENTSGEQITLEMLASFSLGGLSPFASDASPGRLHLHRFRSVWSMEGRLETRTLEEIQLEPSWAGWGVRCERFGALGSLPVNGYFPVAAIEDSLTGVVWAARLAHPGSWQMEVYRRDDTVSFSGGLADREFGHWWKTVAPGECFSSPIAMLTCVAGTVDDACAALVAADEAALANSPDVEHELPVVFNEWMTSWGRPNHENLTALADRLRGSGVKYLVIDAGWFAPSDGDWTLAHGDWVASRALYPDGIRATAEAIHAAGLVPGLWFEMETCGPASSLWARQELLLCRDGRPVTVGGRRFLDFRSPQVIEYLSERVIGLLRSNGFGYVKIDYNDNIGIGVDGAESPGESLRQHLAGVQAFFQRIRRELPGIVIENCSSGGHRLEPSMLGLTDLSSFSDAHECLEAPIIAANLHCLMLPRQSLVWAALRASESPQRTVYSLAAGFLGVLCLSGDFLRLDDAQQLLVQRAVELHAKASPTIRAGRSRRSGNSIFSYRQPVGWQAIVREATNGVQLLVVAHTFADPPGPDVHIQMPPGRWHVIGTLQANGGVVVVKCDKLEWTHGGPWTGLVVLLKRSNSTEH